MKPRHVLAACLAAVLLFSLGAPPARSGDEGAESKLKQVLDESKQVLGRLLDAIEREAFDLDARAKALGGDVDATFAFVRDEIRLEPYAGALRGAAGCLGSGAGNAVDKALLLLELLRRSGHEARLAFGKLPEAEARRMIEAALECEPGPDSGRIDLPYGFDSAPVREERERAVAALEGVVESRMDRLLGAINASLGDRSHAREGVDGGVPVSALLAEATSHAWVQVKRDAALQDLDACLPDTEPGQRLAEAASTGEAVPDDLWHRVRFRVVVERFDGEGVQEESILESTHRAADLSGLPIIFECTQASGGGGPLGVGDLLPTGDDRAAVLRIDGEAVATAKFAYTRPGEGGGFGGLPDLSTPIGEEEKGKPWVVSVALEVETSGPAGVEPAIRRYLLDRWGHAARSSRDVGPLAKAAPLAEEEDPLSRTMFCLGIETGVVNPEALQLRTVATSIAMHDAIVVEGGLVRLGEGPWEASARLTCDAYFHLVDALAEGHLERRGFAPVPRIVTTVLTEVGGRPRLTFDVTRDRRRVVADDLADAYRASLEGGLLSSIVEEELANDPLAPSQDETRVGGSAAGLEAWLKTRAPVLVERRDAIPDVSADARARIGQALALGRIAIAPAEAREGVPFGWYELDPSSGDLVATVETGMHQETIEQGIVTTYQGHEVRVMVRFGHTLRALVRCMVKNITTVVFLALDAKTGQVRADELLEASKDLLVCLANTKGTLPVRNGPKLPKKIRFGKVGAGHTKLGHVGAVPPGKGKWFGEGDWRRRAKQTFKDPDRIIHQPDGRWVFEKQFKNPMGLDKDGNPTNIVRVVVDGKGNLVTAFPSDAWK